MSLYPALMRTGFGEPHHSHLVVHQNVAPEEDGIEAECKQLPGRSSLQCVIKDLNYELMYKIVQKHGIIMMSRE